MLHNMVHPQDPLDIDEITSPLGAHILEFCESDILPVTLPNSEVASNSNCCYDEQSSYQTHPAITSDMNKYDDNEIKTTNIPNSTAPLTPIAITGNNLSMIFDSTDDQLENDISASIDFSLPHQEYFNQEPFDVSSLDNPLPLGDLVDGSLQYDRNQGFQASHPLPGMLPMLGPPPVSTNGYEDDCGLPPYMGYRTSMDPMLGPFLTSRTMSGPPFSCENQAGMFTGSSLMMGNAISHQDLDFQGDNGLFLPDSIMPRGFPSDLQQALSSESQHHGLHGGSNSTTTLSTEISSLDDPTFKVGKLSVEERKRKIHRYMKKRNERNFSKKIKYACRKTLADSRPRVRGRFAKNDEQGEMNRTNGSNHEYDTDEDVSLYSTQMPDDHQRKVGVKEEDDLDSSDIFAHISGVNSFKCNYPIQSWI